MANSLIFSFEKTLYHTRCDRWFASKVRQDCDSYGCIQQSFYQMAWYSSSLFLYSYDLLVPRIKRCLYPRSDPNELGFLNCFPKELIQEIVEYLSIEELLSLSKTSKAARAIFLKPFVLPIDAFGDLKACEKILPIPKNLIEVLEGVDGNLFTAVLVASWFLATIDGKIKIFPATYEEIQRVTEHKKNEQSIVRYIFEPIKKEEKRPRFQKIYWMLISKDVFSETRFLSYEDQVQFVQNWTQKNSLRKGFSIPISAREVFYAFLYRYCEDGVKLYANRPWTYTRCQETIQKKRILIGSFNSDGMMIWASFDDADQNYGVGISQRF